MNPSSPHEIELTDDLIEFAKAVALKEAHRHCPSHVDFRDVVQDALLQLLSKPPKYDPSKGASEKTLIYTVVQRAVLKYAASEFRYVGRFTQLDEAEPKKPDDDEQLRPERDAVERRPVELTTKSSTTEDVLEFIDNEESRKLCRLYIECDNNVSETARRLGVAEGTVRYRLKMLGPKLIAAGFNPFTRRNSDDDGD